MSDTPPELLQAILNSPTYRLAEEDVEFLKLDAMRSVRMQLERHKVAVRQRCRIIIRPEIGLR